MSTPFDQLKKIRLQKLQDIKDLGIDPYPPTPQRNQQIAQVLDMMDQEVCVAGRIRSARSHGNLHFLDLEDFSGKIQVMIRKDEIEETEFKLAKKLDVGDFLSVTGRVFKTEAGQITVQAKKLQLLAKSLRPLPDNWYGLKDVEERYRRRYLDFILNPEVRQKLIIRSQVIQKIRQFLNQENFVEVETPTLEINASGALAKPFSTHINAYDMDIYLRICIGELWQKKMIIGGFDKTFEIGRAFRNEGVSREHNPEFTMLEYYFGYADFNMNMDLQEKLIGFIVKEVLGDYKVKIADSDIDFTPPYPRKKFKDLILEFTKIDIDNFNNLPDLQRTLTNYGFKFDDKWSRTHLIDEFYKDQIRPKLSGPVFVTHHPKDLKPLAKADPGNPEYTQSFQLLVGGFEVSNNYSEINDPIDQASRFKSQKELAASGDDETMASDDEYVEAMEYGMPPISGTGIGIDRLVALLTNSHHIREVMAFPLMKPKDFQVRTRTTTFSNQPFYPNLKKNDYLSISDAAAKKYPSITLGLAIIKGVKVAKENEELSKQIADELKVYEGLQGKDIDDFEQIQSYRQMYKQMGVDWHSRRPSPEALLRRVAQGKDLYQVNTCVDAYNLIVMRYRVSIGTFDLDQIKFPTTLEIGQGGEKILLLGNDGETEIKPGEVFYQDQAGSYNLDFNYRDAQRTAVTEKTTNLLINIDGVYDINRAQVERSLKETLEIITKYCGGEIELTGVVMAK